MSTLRGMNYHPMQCNLLLPESPLLLNCAIEGGYNLKGPEISSIPLEPFCWTMPKRKALAGRDSQGRMVGDGACQERGL